MLLDRGQPGPALDLLTADAAASSSWRVRLWRQWIACGNPVALALTRRAEALYHGDKAAALGTTAAFGRAGYPYQEHRTLLLAAGMEPGTTP